MVNKFHISFIGCLMFTASAPASASEGVGESPIDFYGNRPVISIQLSGMTTIDVVLDTGAQGLILNQRRARLLPLTPAGTREMRSPGGDGLTGMRFEPAEVTFAGIDLGRMGILATDLSTLLSGENAPAGILGLWTLQTGTVEIDYGARRIRVDGSGKLDPDGEGV